MEIYFDIYIQFKTLFMKYIFILGFAVLMLALSCSPKLKHNTVSVMNVNGINQVSTLKQDIAAGQVLYTTKCVKCHGVKDTYLLTHTYAESVNTMASMAKKAKFTQAETDYLSAYVYSAAKK
jgi:mono/diheme cytochrome c family protein